MKPYIAFALAHPLFDPVEDIDPEGHFFWYNRKIFVGLTCNIGME